MPQVVRWYVRTAMAQLVAGMLAGTLVLLNQGLALDARIGTLLPVFYHLLMVGWATQLIAGVPLWMFPPFSRERPRGNERLAKLAYAGLNAGLATRVIAEPAHAWQPASWSGWLLAGSAALQTLAIWILVALLWPCVRGKPAR